MEKVINKRVLIISNNPFSNTENNGKTLASIFAKYDQDNINQLYFENSYPTALENSNFFRITDEEILNKFLNNKNETKKDGQSRKETKSSHSNLARIFREFIWKEKYWLTKELEKWLEEISPEIVFFMAGDSGFAYNITNYVIKKFNSELITYVTDDYILPNLSFNIFETARRLSIRRKMKKVFKKSKKVFTISPAMQYEYYNRFAVKSEVLANITNYGLQSKKYKKNQKYVIVYAGGLHYGRLNPILKMAKEIQKLKYQDYFEINLYTSGKIKKNMINKYDDVLRIHKPVLSDKLREVYNEADLLLHVESFKSKYKKKTKLSLSTKIPEYILSRRPILAYGPKRISSMAFLEDISIFSFNKKQLRLNLMKVHKKPEELNILVEKALKKYNKFYNININSEELV